MSINVCVDPSPVAPGLALLYERQYLTDVRLVCGDGKVLVHKVVLFAVSDLLQDLLSDQSGHHCDNTVILLDNSVTDVKKIIDCLYYGHQSIASNRFSYLSRIAAKLGIVLRSAVSVALEDNKQTIDWQRALPPTPHPKTGRRSTISSSHKKLINRLAVTAENVESDPFVLPNTPLNLSVPKPILVDNVSKIIEEVATNGPREKRRRKQLTPKSVKKTVRFDETSDYGSENGHHDHHNDSSLIDLTVGSEQLSLSEADTSNLCEIGIKLEAASHRSLTSASSTIRPSPGAITAVTGLKIGRPKGRPPKKRKSEEVNLQTNGSNLSQANKPTLANGLGQIQTSVGLQCLCGKQEKNSKTLAEHSVQCNQVAANMTA